MSTEAIVKNVKDLNPDCYVLSRGPALAKNWKIFMYMEQMQLSRKSLRPDWQFWCGL